MRHYLCAFLVCVPSLAVATPEADVRATFDRYRKAAVHRDGSAASLEVDENTVRYYGTLRTTALVAPDAHALPIVDKIIVLRARAEMTPDELSSLDGRAFVAHALSRGWIVTSQLARASLGTIRVIGDGAEAQLLVGKVAAPTPFSFRREKGKWRVDLTAFNAASGAALSALATGRKLSEDELALRMLTELLGHPAPESVWRPMIPSAPRPR